MIYKLQRKFIAVSAISLFSVILLMFVAFTVLNFLSMNRSLDALTERISKEDGRFNGQADEPPQKPDGPRPQRPTDFITPETPFSTRHFTVWFDSDYNAVRTNTEFIYSIDDETAEDYGMRAIEKGEEMGWISNYRYRLADTERGLVAVFVDGSTQRAAFLRSLLIALCVLLASALVVITLIFIFSKRAMKPVAESYEKQKQFITDANHELKTPLTLILANLELAKCELGENEWLEDIRIEGEKMTELVNQLVSLSRMDETRALDVSEIEMDELVHEAISTFDVLAANKGKRITLDVDQEIRFHGDEMLVRRLVGILLDNAVKYCDEGGEIKVSLKQKRHIILTVENSYSAAESLELDRLFDRFYRSDKARSSAGYGIGLSIAKAIVQAHRGEITSYKPDSTHIGFKVVMK